MAIADSSRIAVRWAKELSWGSVPVGPMTNIRFTSANLSHTKDTVVSTEIRDDRQVPDAVEVGVSAQGDIACQLSFKEYDAFLEAALQSTFTTELYAGAGIAGDILFEGDPYNRIHMPKDKLPNAKVGMYMKAGGATNTGNNAYFKITAITRNTGNKDVFTVDGPLTEEDNATATLYISNLRNGTTETSFTLEKEHKDVGRFFSFTGMEINQWVLNLANRAIVNMTFSFMGKEGAHAAATVGTGAAIAAGTQDILNASNNVGRIEENGVELATAIETLDLTLVNNLRLQPKIAAKAPAGVGSGRCVVTGTLRVYFENGNLYAEFLAHSKTNIHARLVDADGDRYFVTMPHVKFLTDDAAPAPGNDQDVKENIGYQAFRDATLDYTIQIDKFTASQ